MDTTWIAPPAVLGIGAAVAALLVRAISMATDDARDAVRRFGRLEGRLVPLRVETRRTRESVDRMTRR
ncbi:MAG: hypothetical protein KDA98_01750 [Acidimicrobiales bacterium]|nr:hypothetical protein [Acidimicrobiales bacterium]